VPPLGVPACNKVHLSFVKETSNINHMSDNKTELLPGFLPLVPNMPVLLTDNIACELGLSNGTQGIFRELVYDDQEHSVTFNVSNAVFPSILFMFVNRYMHSWKLIPRK
jgi:hypothetical protein